MSLNDLLRAIGPMRSQIRATGVGDWALRRRRALNADLPLGFDPLLYLDVDTGGTRDPTVPPFRLGAYGYWDDHPLASRRWGKPAATATTAAALAARAAALWVQAPTGAIWYIAARLLARALDDGFDWIASLHRQGAQVAAWTLDADRPLQVALARRLTALGVDRIITNNAPRLARELGASAEY